jgi:hypothetical protein
MPGHRWHIYDPVTLEDVEVPLNPSEARLPAVKKAISTAKTSAPTGEGRIIATEGIDDPLTMGFTGVMLDLDQYNFFFDLCYNKRYQVRLTDDWGRVYWVYPTSLEATRGRHKPSHPEFQRYTMDFLVLDWPDA